MTDTSRLASRVVVDEGTYNLSHPRRASHVIVTICCADGNDEEWDYMVPIFVVMVRLRSCAAIMP